MNRYDIRNRLQEIATDSNLWNDDAEAFEAVDNARTSLRLAAGFVEAGQLGPETRMTLSPTSATEYRGKRQRQHFRQCSAFVSRSDAIQWGERIRQANPGATVHVLNREIRAESLRFSVWLVIVRKDP